MTSWAVRHSLFAPDKHMIWAPDEYVDMMIEDVNGFDTINSWYVKNNEKSTCMLFFHGNNGNMSWREYMVNMTKEIGVNLFMIDYRGFGKSRGNPTQRSLLEDGESAYRYITKKYKNCDIIVWGESLGGAIASHVASKHKCRCLVLLSTFSSLDDVVLEYHGNYAIRYLMSLLIKYIVEEMPIKSWIKCVKSPVVIIHSKSDETIPFEVSNTLFENISHEQKTHIKIKGKHSSPEMTRDNLMEILDICGISFNGKTITKALKCIDNIKFPIV